MCDSRRIFCFPINYFYSKRKINSKIELDEMDKFLNISGNAKFYYVHMYEAYGHQ